MLALSGQVFAGTYNWTGLGGNTNWNNSNNWTGGAVGTFPGASDDVRIGVIVYVGVQPTINTTGLSCATLTIGNLNTVILTVNNAFSVSGLLQVKGNTTFTGSATITLGSIQVTAFTFNINTPLVSLGSFQTNGSTVTSNATGTINTAGLSMVSSTVTLNGVITSSASVQMPSAGTLTTLTTNGTGNAFNGGIYDHTGADLTWNGTGTTTCSQGDVSSGQTLTIGTGNTVTFTGNLEMHGNNPTVGMLVNNGTIKSNSSIFSDNISTAVTSITNTGTITFTASTGQLSLGAYTAMANTGTINTVSGSNINTGSNSVINNNTNGKINCNDADINLRQQCYPQQYGYHHHAQHI